MPIHRSLSLLVVFCLFVVGWVPVAGQVAAADPPPGSTATILRFGVHVSTMGNLDPHFATGSQDRALADMLFNGLLRYQPGNAPKIEPDLAEQIPEFEMIGGRQVWTVRLRRGVWFHPGPQTPAHELTAEDVVFSLKKSADPAGSTFAAEYEGWAVEAVDRYTLRIILESPLSTTLFLPKLTDYAGGFIVSRQAVEAMGHEGFRAHPVGTGPFMFNRFEDGDKLVLNAHDRYFRGRPLLDGVEIHLMPHIADREAALKAGRLEVILGSGELGWADQMAGEPGFVLDTHGVGEVIVIYFNTRMKPLDDRRVRWAMAYALDREAFLATISKRFAEAVYSPVPACFIPGGLTREETTQLQLDFATDLDKARRLLAEAGYPQGFELDLVSSEKRLYRTCYEELARQLAQIGIRCRIEIQPHAEMHRAIRQDPRPLVIYVAWRPNADTYLSHFFHSEAIVLSGHRPDTNFSHYDRIDPLIEAARTETDPQRQTQLWVQAQIRILDDMAAYPVMFARQCYVRSARVDYGHPLVSTMALYPQFTEKTRLTAGP